MNNKSIIQNFIHVRFLNTDNECVKGKLFDPCDVSPEILSKCSQVSINETQGLTLGLDMEEKRILEEYGSLEEYIETFFTPQSPITH